MKSQSSKPKTSQSNKPSYYDIVRGTKPINKPK